jgi:hypothetical protein
LSLHANRVAFTTESQRHRVLKREIQFCLFSVTLSVSVTGNALVIRMGITDAC